MKRYIILFLSLILVVGLLAGCNKGPDATNTDTLTEQENPNDQLNPSDRELDVYVQDEIILNDINDVEEREIVTSNDGKYTYKENSINGVTLVSIVEAPTGEYQIPTTIDNKKVTKIGNAAFSNSNITKVSIPDGILIIGDYAFQNCSNLVNVSMGNSVIKISDGAFLNNASLTNIEFSSKLLEIGTCAFAGCAELATVELPDTLRLIGVGGFSYSGLTTIKLPETIKSIQDRTFCGCSKLKTVEMSETMYEIMDSAFADCEELEVTINNCEKICSNAFDNVKKANYNKESTYEPYDLMGENQD